MVVILGLDGSVLLPKEIREGLDANALFEVEPRPDGVIELRPYGMADPDNDGFGASDGSKWNARRTKITPPDAGSGSTMSRFLSRISMQTLKTTLIQTVAVAQQR